MFARLLNEFAPLFQLRDQIDRAFDQYIDEGSVTRRSYSASYPGLNVWESSDRNSVLVEAELPGLRLEDIELTVLGNQLSLSGERRLSTDTESEAARNATWHRRERAHGRFTRTLTLPFEIDSEKVEARLRDGVLTITLPKSESAKPRKVKLLSA
jgi:HSP20 family protein